MAINLQKGQKIDLSKGNDGLTHIMVGLGWDEVDRSSGGFFGLFKSEEPEEIDCDASVILCDANGKMIIGQGDDGIKEGLVYFGNLRHRSGAIIHQGDNLTGGGDGDDEEIFVDLRNIPSNIHKLVFVVNIYDAEGRKQHFGMIKNAFIRLVDTDKRTEICRFNLSDNYERMTGLIVGEIYRHNGQWKFNAVGQPVREASRLDAFIRMYA